MENKAKTAVRLAKRLVAQFEEDIEVTGARGPTEDTGYYVDARILVSLECEHCWSKEFDGLSWYTDKYDGDLLLCKECAESGGLIS